MVPLKVCSHLTGSQRYENLGVLIWLEMSTDILYKKPPHWLSKLLEPEVMGALAGFGLYVVLKPGLSFVPGYQ